MLPVAIWQECCGQVWYTLIYGIGVEKIIEADVMIGDEVFGQRSGAAHVNTLRLY